jgi:hypothetical protein
VIIRLDIEILEIDKGGTKKGGGNGVGGWGKMYGVCWVLWPFCVFGCISVAVVEGAYIRDCRELGLYIIGTVG